MSLADDMYRSNEDKTDWWNYTKDLEQKLKEQRALFVDMGKHPDTPSLYAMYMRYRNYHNEN